MISVVIPLKNEERNVPLLAEKLTKALNALARAYEVIFINDGSTDGTTARLREICSADHHLKAIHFRRNHGQTAAMQAGFHHASGAIIVAMDGDLQNDPADIGKVVAKLDEGYDLVSGWRKDRQDAPIKRNFLSRVANGLISRTTGERIATRAAADFVVVVSTAERIFAIAAGEAIESRSAISGVVAAGRSRGERQ